MLKRKNNKRGFTVVELTIVVSVIAILSAVLIPTFAGITKKARQNADETAVRNLNTVIATAEDDITDVNDLIDFLEKNDIAAGSYSPMSKNYSFVWNTADNVVMLYSAKDKAIVFPKEYKGQTNLVYETLVKENVEEIVTAENKESFTDGGVVAVNSDIALSVTDKYISVKNDLVVDLAGKVSTPDRAATGGVFTVFSGSTLTLNGNGTVDGNASASDYNIAIWVYGGDAVINGGTYTNIGAKNADGSEDTQQDLIYVSNGGKLTINGGTFICETPEWTLNSSDKKPGAIIVKGGEFCEFNPKTDVHDMGIQVPDEYDVKTEVRDGKTWYIVYKK